MMLRSHDPRGMSQHLANLRRDAASVFSSSLPFCVDSGGRSYGYWMGDVIAPIQFLGLYYQR